MLDPHEVFPDEVMKRLYPDLSDEERKIGAVNLVRYIEIMLRIFERLEHENADQEDPRSDSR